jgi:bis(5'-nucleosyl)-tetraphosphatase (symmetrical)
MDSPQLKRTIIVGDVHGCLDELQELLAKVRYDSAVDELVLVGDLVGKGPKSYEVIQFVKSNNIKCVLGILLNININPLRKS